MIDGFSKDDPPTRKMLPVESDVPELLVEMGYGLVFILCETLSYVAVRKTIFSSV